MNSFELEQKLNSTLADNTRYSVGQFYDRIEDEDLLNEPKTMKTVETFLSKKEAISLVLRSVADESIDRIRKECSSVVVQLQDVVSYDQIRTFNRRIVIAECW